jgi:hypothetical protein
MSFWAFQIALAADIGAEWDTLILQVQQKFAQQSKLERMLWNGTGGDRRCAVPTKATHGTWRKQITTRWRAGE